MAKSLFVTGTGTDVGKTYITGLILKKFVENHVGCAYYKAAMSGNERADDGHLVPGDALFVKKTSGVAQPLDTMCPYLYEAAVSPHLAAKIEGNPINLDVVLAHYDDLCRQYDFVTVEGSGGIVCPLRYDDQEIFLEDIIKVRGMGCLLVADAGLGTINDVVLSVRYMEARQIPVRGIVFNRFEPGNVLHEDNRSMCERLTGVQVVTCVKDGDSDIDISIDDLKRLYS